MAASTARSFDADKLALALYADVLDGHGLDAPLAAITAALGGSRTIAHRIPAKGDVTTQGLVSLWNFPLEAAIDYQTNWVGKDPWVTAGRHASNDILNLTALVPERELYRTEIWNDWLRLNVPCVHGLSMKFAYPDSVMGVFTSWSGSADQPFGAEAEALLAHLRPHLIRAFTAEARLAATALQTHALDALAEGLAIIAPSGRLVFASAALQRMAAAGDGLALGPNGPLAATRPAQTALDRAIGLALLAAAGRAELRPEEGSLALPRPSGDAPWLLEILPLPPGRSGAFAGQAGCVILVNDPNAPRTPSEHLLTALYGLTPSEASLAAALLAGASIAEHAKRRRIGIATARTHLSRILEKTGTRRQGDLIARLAAVLR